jgi:hypothetical protein
MYQHILIATDGSTLAGEGGTLGVMRGPILAGDVLRRCCVAAGGGIGIDIQRTMNLTTQDRQHSKGPQVPSRLPC